MIVGDLYKIRLGCLSQSWRGQEPLPIAQKMLGILLEKKWDIEEDNWFYLFFFPENSHRLWFRSSELCSRSAEPLKQEEL